MPSPWCSQVRSPGKLGNLIGVGSTGVQVWEIAKWPVMALIVALILAILYYFGPNVRQPAVSRRVEAPRSSD